MPCRSDEEEAQIQEPPNPVTPTKPQHNDGACHNKSDAEIPLTGSNEEEEERPKQKRKCAPRVLAIYEVIQRWVTSNKATQPEEDIEREIFENAKRIMHLSGLEKQTCHKVLDTDLYAWRKAGTHSSRGVNVSETFLPRDSQFFSRDLHTFTGIFLRVL
jgi:hypothetical protein